MKILIVLTILFTATTCFAQNYRVQSMGNTDYYYGSDGSMGMGQQQGNTYYYQQILPSNPYPVVVPPNTPLSTYSPWVVSPKNK